MRIFIFVSILLMSCRHGATGQVVMPLYNGEIPNSLPAPNQEWQEKGSDSILRIHAVSHPTLTIFLPAKEKRTGDAVVICPGGGYTILAAGHEGYDVARAFAEKGIAAFVLKYRLPDDKTMVDKSIGPLQDAQRAIQIVRENARKWQISRVGIMGFSAGGHLAATAGTQFEKALIPNKKNLNLRPDFMALIYPVISFQDSLTHMGSRERLIGKNPSPEKIRAFSNELNVTSKTPRTFLVHAEDDKAVKIANSEEFEKALRRAGVSSSSYFTASGGHGFGMFNKMSGGSWMEALLDFILETNDTGTGNTEIR